MFVVRDQWDCEVARFEEREDAQAYIAERELAYKLSPSIGPRWYIYEET
jgi:hypothetical protein